MPFAGSSYFSIFPAAAGQELAYSCLILCLCRRRCEGGRRDGGKGEGGRREGKVDFLFLKIDLDSSNSRSANSGPADWSLVPTFHAAAFSPNRQHNHNSRYSDTRNATPNATQIATSCDGRALVHLKTCHLATHHF